MSMSIIDTIKKSRSYRRFDQKKEIPDNDLQLMIEAARFSPSSRNIQPLKYFPCNNTDLCKKIFGTLAWAGYLKDWDGPEEGERPSAYIVILHDTSVSSTYSCDDGIAAQSILLQGVELGYGGCIISSVKRERLSEILNFPDNLNILHVIAIGVPKEKIVLEDMHQNNYKYWRETDGTHHVPKRTLKELIIK
ncbi:MAG: nitroreductase family protein [Bacteroidales bacterium]